MGRQGTQPNWLEQVITGGQIQQLLARLRQERAERLAFLGSFADVRALDGKIWQLEDALLQTMPAERFQWRSGKPVRDLWLGQTIAQTRKELSKMIHHSSPQQTFKSIKHLTDERDKFRTEASRGLLLRCGFEAPKEDRAAYSQNEFAGYTLPELAAECLRRSGLPRPGYAVEMVGRAMTSTDFPHILANVANKFLLEGYQDESETWRQWCGIGVTKDFKQTTIARLGAADSLDEISEGGEYKYGGLVDAKEVFSLVTYGKMFAIYRQTIINDDLYALTDIPRAHGEAASRKIGDLAYSILTTNAAMGDGVALFHSSHGNLMTSGVLSATTLAEGIKLMKVQRDIGGNQRLNIRTEYAIAPAALEGTWEQFFNSGIIGGATATDAGRANLVNPYGGTRFTRVYDARLDDSSAAAWYLAGPKGKTVTMFFLPGQDGPFLDQEDGWSVDGMEYKVRIDAVAKAVDWKALVKNAGG
jgi:hypothetical protein